MNTLKNFEIIPFDPRYLNQMAETEAETLGDEGWSEKSILETVNFNGTYFIALVNGQYAGHGGFTTVLDECYITNIAIDKSFRRIGLGSAILEKMICEAKQKDALILTLEVRQSNQPAISLYNKYNFLEVGKRKKFYTNPKEDAVIMTLKFR